MSIGTIGRFVAVSVLALLPSLSAAQSATTGAIAGVVKDASGAVLPGVTVEAASPALIEKVRSVVTDGQGNYKATELRPGTYTVTFTLPGFVTLKREGVEISTGVTANVAADMRVGGIEETVTVTGASPVVDIQNVRSQTVLTREALDALPTNKTLQSFAALTLGANMAQANNQDVGGNQGEAGGFGYFSVHGGRGNDQRMTIEGMHFYALIGSGAAGNRTNYVNQMAVAETAIQTGGYGAEAETGGVQINAVPRDGGNTFSGSIFTNGTGGRFQSNNLDDDLRSKGITTSPNVKNIYDLGVGFGGPLKQDKLWFYTAHRRWGTKNTVPGMYFNKTPGTGVYTADLTRPAFTWIHNRDHQGRLTWQVTPKMKLTASQGVQWDANEYYEVDRGRAPEGSTWLQWSPNSLTIATWTWAKTNRLLFEAGQSSLWEDQTNSLVKSGDAGKLADDYTIDARFVSISEIGGGFPNLYNGRANGLGQVDPGRGSRVHVFTQRASMSYITGSHALKVGFQGLYSPAKSAAQMPNYIGLGPVQYVYRFGQPFQLRQWRSPLDRRNRVYVSGLFAQDQWTLSRLTLNLGVRYDQLDGWVPPESVPAIPEFNLPALSFPEVRGVPNWKTLLPRVGAAYDVFGNGRTAIKGSIGRYNETETNGIASNNNPLNRIASQTLRAWADANGNRVPDCDLKSSAANGECGGWLTPGFGTAGAANTFDPDVLSGWYKRPYSMQASATLQQELANNMALTVGYFRTWFGQQRITVNRTTQRVGVDEFCITAPNDARLGDYSNRRICGLYDAKVVAAPDNFITQANNFGKNTEVSNFFDVGLQLRFGKGGLIQGGMSTGRTVVDNCELVQSNLNIALTVATYNLQPSGLGSRTDKDFCRVVTPWRGLAQYKAAVNYPLPYGIRVAGTLQNLPGLPIQAIMNITGAATNLGRGLTTGAANVTVKVPNTDYLDRLNQVDVRLSKSIKLGRYKMEGQFDVYNALNANTTLQINPTYGASWQRPLAILGARLLKFGAQIDF